MLWFVQGHIWSGAQRQGLAACDLCFCPASEFSHLRVTCCYRPGLEKYSRSLSGEAERAGCHPLLQPHHPGHNLLAADCGARGLLFPVHNKFPRPGVLFVTGLGVFCLTTSEDHIHTVSCVSVTFGSSDTARAPGLGYGIVPGLDTSPCHQPFCSQLLLLSLWLPSERSLSFTHVSCGFASVSIWWQVSESCLRGPGM